jgi:lysophospholipase L1-like esterase
VRRFRVSFALLAFGLLYFVLIAGIWVFTPAPSVRQQVGETQIIFSADRGFVLLPNECVRVSWAIDNTLGVKVNGELLPTPAEKEVCITPQTQPTITVILLDNTEVTVTLTVGILVATPLVIIAFLIGCVSIVGAFLNALRVWTGETDIWRIPVVQKMVRGAVWTLISVAITWAILDAGLRWYFSTYGTEPQKIMYIYSVDEIRAKTSNLIHVPYVSYLPNPDYAGHNTLGFRGEYITPKKPEGVFRIVALGGSTTYSTGTSASESYPALLQKFLREDYGYANVEVINAGFIGYTSWEALTTFSFRVLPLEPDMVIYYEGVNDLAVRERASTNCYNGENPMRGLNPERGIFVERTQAFPASTLYRILAVTLGWMPNPLALDSAFEPPLIECLPDASNITLEQRLAQNTPTYFERNIKNLVYLAQANGVHPIISSWVYNVNANRPQLWRDQIGLQNEVLRQIANDTNTPFYDLASSFPSDNALWEADGIHMIASGTAEQARQYAQWLVDEGLIR